MFERLHPDPALAEHLAIVFQRHGSPRGSRDPEQLVIAPISACAAPRISTSRFSESAASRSPASTAADALRALRLPWFAALSTGQAWQACLVHALPDSALKRVTIGSASLQPVAAPRASTLVKPHTFPSNMLL
ncbi:hypothetical protein TGAM01_v209798 [Trichoderma gamsii]|uniref:Uncharacterized protein n=1 Tax=Trichoderma gamsii TaxID=398673 RepID=A0A2P4ZAQ3_9HYPO|nr:hypothetical protein TGAM01_v209798 [Trichoderma gamsii]PON21347.1 hypothetical protein TGAM01_v209798 [Trichoderma gamsii]